MAVFRSIAFYTGLVLMLAGCGLLSIPALIRRDSDKILTFVHYGFRRAQWLAIHLLKVKIVWRNARPDTFVYDGDCIIASQHQSMIDPVLLGGAFDRPAFVLKEELRWVPVIGLYCQMVGMILIDRKQASISMRRILTGLRRCIEEKRTVIIFPEGTRRPYGAPLELMPGLFLLYRKSGLPVVPIALDSGRLWPKRRLIVPSGTVSLAWCEPIAPGLSREAFEATLKARFDQAQTQLTS